MAEVERSRIDISVLIIFKHLVSNADLICFFVVLPQNEDEPEGNSDETADIGEVVIKFIELPRVGYGFWRFSEIDEG